MADSYSALFSVSSVATDDGPDLLQYVRDVVHAWASRADASPPLTPGHHVVSAGDEYEISSDRCEEGEFWRLRWTRPDADGRALSWVSDVRLAREIGAPGIEVSVQVRVVETDAALPERISIGTPRLLSILANDARISAHVEGRPLDGSRSVNIESAERFVADDVLSPGRVLPIIAVSPRIDDNRHYFSADQMKRFLGLAEPWFIQTASPTRLVSNLIGAELSCYNGAVRIWWPGLSPDADDPRRHQLWLPWQVAEAPQRAVDAIYNLLTRVSERRVADGGPVWKTILSASTRAREDRLRSALADAELVGLAAEVESELRIARADASDLRTLNDSLRATNEQLTADVELLKERLSDAYRSTEHLPKEQQPVSQPTIADIGDAVLAADGRFPYLRFTEESFDSAERSQFQRPEEVYRAFQVLDSIGAEMAARDGNIGSSLYDRLKSEGLDYRGGEGGETMARWAAERRATFDSKTYEMERHLAWGGPRRQSQEHIRVYFEWEPGGPFWIIGHVGDHPTTRKS